MFLRWTPRPEMDATWNSRTHFNYVHCFSFRIRPHLAFKLTKGANITPIFLVANWVSLNATFSMDSKSASNSEFWDHIDTFC